jgi:hypothetical protein
MKKYINIGIVCLFAVALLSSCSDYFDSDSKSVIKTDNMTYKDELTARSGMFGLLQGLQTIGDSYVIMGELRGDLMTVTDNSSQELRDINNFNISSDNSYLKERQYYALLNNCNYYITHLDTATTTLVNGKASKVLRPYLAEAKAIRAWTYLQLCLDYGKVKYATEPVLDGTDTSAVRTVNLDALLPLLITDLEGVMPWMTSDVTPLSADWVRGNADPGFSTSVSYESYTARQLMFPVRFVLGELYMWNEDFLKAAQAYHDLIYLDKLTLSNSFRDAYEATGTKVTIRNWANQFSSFNYADILTAIVFTDQYKGNSSSLYDMFNTDYVLAPSTALINTFDAQFYYTTRSISGDLRGPYGTYTSKTTTTGASEVTNAYVTKFNSLKSGGNYYISPCRTSLIYLRYAEAINRLGKSKLAFYGLLKYGLCAYNINLYKDKEPLSGEITGEPWIDFGQSNPAGDVADIFSANTKGLHARGCGNTDMNEAYKMEECASRQDTIQWVEDQLINEYALECGLEGNRFHDLMRIARYRGSSAYLAAKVSEKYSGGEKTAMYNKLLTQANWYLPSVMTSK